MTEKVRRLNPTPATLRRLFALSQNRCAFAECDNPVIDGRGSLLAEVCHIEAANNGGPRFNPLQTNEQRRQFENLVVLCRHHHVVTDNVTDFPTAAMVRLKSVHEGKAYAATSSNSEMQERFVDQSLSTSIDLPENFGQLDLSGLNLTFFDDARHLMSTIASLPSLSRSLYAHALAYSHAPANDLSLYCVPNELEQRLCASRAQLQPHFELLEMYRLMWMPEYKDDWRNLPSRGYRSYFRQFDLEDNGIYFLWMVRQRFDAQRATIVDIFDSLNFGLLDV